MSSIGTMRNISLSNYFAQAVLKNVEAAGLNKAQLLQSAGIAPDLLAQPDARIPAVQFGRLQTKTIFAMRDEFVGYGPQAYLPGTWTNMCHSVIHCTSLGHALARYCRFYQMFEWGFQGELIIDGEFARLRFEAGKGVEDYGVYGWEMLLFNAHRFASWLIRQHLPLQAVNLSYDAPAHVAEYRHLFLGQPIFFNKPHTELVFHRSLTELPLSQNETSLRRFLKHPNLVFLVQQYPQKSWSTEVRLIINKQLTSTPGLEDIAQSLGLHPQTLRRRLAQEGTTFNDIKTQCRRDTALYFLGKSSFTIEQIALRTGFSETSAFTRAFKTWTGVPPQSYRQQLAEN
ncbi:MAG: AraC family transcriptional regulator [Spongiibacter sp.]|nr:AraC family transcriptional regulator [Spongiibacter sp.]